jgi:glycosyltransferase involved in cell wall biosynthesis
MRLAMIYHRFLPYHVPRLEAAARRGDLVGIEAVAGDETCSFRREALFTDTEAGPPPVGRLRRRLNDVLVGIAPDVVAISSWGHSFSLCALEWCYAHRVPAVIVNVSQRRDFPRQAWKEALKRRVLRHVGAGLATGRRSAAYLGFLGVASDRVVVGGNAVDNAHFAAGAEEARRRGASAREELDLPPRYVLASGRFVPKKNLLGLLDAFAVVAREPAGAGFGLVLLGDGPLRGDLESRADRLGIGERVRMPGFRGYEELPAYYGLAHGFVHVSLREQWGLVVNEALASGLPAVVSEACGCVPELLEDGGNGFVCRAEDQGSIVAALRQLLSLSDERRARMVELGRRRVEQCTPARFAEGLWQSAETAMRYGAPAVPAVDRMLALAMARRLPGASGD